MTNRHHANARYAKALRLAEFLAQVPESTSATVALLSPARRRQIEAMAGEARPASDETWAIVVETLQRWEAKFMADVLRIIDDERLCA